MAIPEGYVLLLLIPHPYLLPSRPFSMTSVCLTSYSQLRASYPIISHTEAFLAPHSLAFSPTSYGSRLYAGHENAVEVFDIARPGEGERVMLRERRKEKGGFNGSSPPTYSK
jgi:hypothetical protein